MLFFAVFISSSTWAYENLWLRGTGFSRIKDDMKKYRVLVFKGQGQLSGERQAKLLFLGLWLHDMTFFADVFFCCCFPWKHKANIVYKYRQLIKAVDCKLILLIQFLAGL